MRMDLPAARLAGRRRPLNHSRWSSKPSTSASLISGQAVVSSRSGGWGAGGSDPAAQQQFIDAGDPPPPHRSPTPPPGHALRTRRVISRPQTRPPASPASLEAASAGAQPSALHTPPPPLSERLSRPRLLAALGAARISRKSRGKARQRYGRRNRGAVRAAADRCPHPRRDPAAFPCPDGPDLVLALASPERPPLLINHYAHTTPLSAQIAEWYVHKDSCDKTVIPDIVWHL